MFPEDKDVSEIIWHDRSPARNTHTGKCEICERENMLLKYIGLFINGRNGARICVNCEQFLTDVARDMIVLFQRNKIIGE